MALSRESEGNFQPWNQFGLKKSLSGDEPTAEYRIISADFPDSRFLPQNRVMLVKRRIEEAIQRYRKIYGLNGEKSSK